MKFYDIQASLIGSRNVVAISTCRTKLADLDVMTSWDAYFLTREMANHRARSLICIPRWEKPGNLEKPVRGGEGVARVTVSGRRPGERPVACIMILRCCFFLTSNICFIHVQLTKIPKSSFDGLYGNRGALIRHRINVHGYTQTRIDK